MHSSAVGTTARIVARSRSSAARLSSLTRARYSSIVVGGAAWVFDLMTISGSLRMSGTTVAASRGRDRRSNIHGILEDDTHAGRATSIRTLATRPTVERPSRTPTFIIMTAAPTPPTPTPYEQLGGDAGVRKLVDRFYDLIDTAPEAATIRALHARSLRPAREKLYLYLTTWTGGPPVYTERYGHPRLRM